MKTSLLFILAFVTAFSVSAQKSSKFAPDNTAKFKYVELMKRVETDNPSSLSVPSSRPNLAKHPGDVTKVPMGSSRNIFSVLLTEQTCIWYNAELDAIMGTTRGNDKGTVALLGTGNDICTYWSSDGGNTFTGKLSFPVVGTKLSRYPQGAIYNMPGNTDVASAFSVVSGPTTTGAWDFFYMSSVQYNGDNMDYKFFPADPSNLLERNGLYTCTDGYAHTSGQNYESSPYTWAYAKLANGKFNSNTFAFDWDTLRVQIPFKPDPTGALDAMLGQSNMAWSKDGSVGYLLSIGVDTRSGDNKGYFPILHKSTDQGKTWQLMDYFDFSSLPAIKGHIWTNLTNRIEIPFFSESDIVIDANGYPHVFAKCKGQYSQHPDSLGYTYTNETGSIFEFAYDGTTWHGNFIDHLKSGDVSSANSPMIYSAGANQGWDNRLQASRTDDGKKVFAVWTDTDWTFWAQNDSINLNPDVKIWGRDVTTNKHTIVKNVTELTDAYGGAFFMYASPIVRSKDGVFEIPVFINDINQITPPSADEPSYHYYLKGVSLSEADFNLVGVDKGTKAEGIAASVYPNPFKGEANVSISLDKPSNVNIVISSITGKQVKSMNYGNLNGKQNLKLDGSNLPSGVYFCTITAGDKKVTNKLVIK